MPRLRFPEFRDAGEWNERNINNICRLQAGKFVAATDIFESHNAGLYPCYGGNGLRGYTATYTHSGKYPLIGRQGALCGNIKMAKGQFHATEHALVATPSANVDVDFLFYMLDFLELNRYATGQAQPGLSVDVLEKISAFIPKDKLEQQRIADCLSSLDERIAAETSKLDTLKDHKKGLLKQLFPAEGETLPRLRFPEFRDAGEWKKADFGKIAKFLSGGTPSKDVSEYWGGDIPWISASSMHNTKIEKSDCHITKLAISNGARIVPKGTLLLLVRGSMLHKRILLGISELDLSFNQDVKALALNADITELYLMYFLMASEPKLLAAVVQTGIGAGKLDTDDLNNFLIMMPSPIEQQRIADCLSSLDELITAQAQKIDLLKTHKKGLMQQLFPVIDEAKA